MTTQRKRMAATKKADQVFSAAVRSRGVCEMAPLFPAITCNGNLQCAHIVSRRYRAVRWREDNAFCACAAHHLYQTHHPLEFEDALDTYDQQDMSRLFVLKQKALNAGPMDPHEVIERYKETV